MTVINGRRTRRVLSPDEKWKIFLQVATGEITESEAARTWQVDVSTIASIGRTAREAAVAAFAADPGRSATAPDAEHEQVRGELMRLTQAVQTGAVELARVSRQLWNLGDGLASV
jgi:transposase-like protein